DHVVLNGVGGSAVAGGYLQVLFDSFGSLPLSVTRNYEAPVWVSNRTLVIVSSYSGNTEETLSAYDEARSAGATVLAITSGGLLAERAAANRNVLLTIPGGQPPRTALGYSFVTLLQVLQRSKLIEPQYLNGLPDFLTAQCASWKNSVPF